MATINFTGATTASTSIDGYFGLFGSLFPDGIFPNTFTSYTTAGVDWTTKTTDGTRSLATYFSTSSLMAAPTTWNFSSNADAIAMFPISLRDANGSTIGVHTFENDVLNLGGGSDYLRLNSGGFWSTPNTAPYVSTVDQALDGGFQVTINGGPGNDTIISIWQIPDYIVDRTNTTTKTTVIPVAIVNGDAGNDDIRIEKMAGRVNGDTPGGTATGADVIRTDVFSDRILGGASADIINATTDKSYLAYNELNSEDEIFFYKQALIQKDLITGGTGKDTFVLEAFNAYGLNGANDFAVITDFESTDRIASALYRGDLLIDGTDGSLSLAATSAYTATTVTYTARIYLDSDASNTVSTDDELLLYVCGAQPTAANFVYGI